MNNLRLALRLSLACCAAAAIAHAHAPRAAAAQRARNTSAPQRDAAGGRRSDAATHKSKPGRAEDELLIKFDAKSAPSTLNRAHARAGARVLREFPALGWQLVRLPRALSVERALELYRAAPGVTAAQPNYIYRLAAAPNDPRYASGEMYGLAKIKAPTAWDISTGSPSVVVAVIDTGVKYAHEDLQANMWANPGETPANGIDDDANGYVDDVRGADVRNNDGDPNDDHGHGTHVAGTIGATGNNALGVAGVNWNVRLMAVKIFDAAGVATTAHAIAGLQYVTLMRGRGVNLRVSNSSWGGAPEAPNDDPALREAFRAAGAAGVLNVTAAGNDGRDTDAQPFYPANFRVTNLVSVAASDSNDNRAGFSNYGATSVDLAAPGSNILSTIIGTAKYGSSSGTSMASPHVAGAAALLSAHAPALSAASLKATLMNTVDQLPQWSLNTVSGGRLNVAAALAGPTACAYALSPPAAAFQVAGGTGGFTVDTSANCDWAAVSSDPSWLSVTSNTPASGDGTVNFSVAPMAGTPRNGTITVGDQTFNVTQSSGCTYQISPASLPQFPAAGGQGTLAMTAPSGCQWTAFGLAPWISVTQGGGSGSGTITFNVAPNYGTARVGQILHTDDSFYGIAQAGAPAGDLLISEFRIDGPAGPADEFVELYNNTDSAVTVSTTDGSAGWSVVAFLSNGNPPTIKQTICTVPAGTAIPARGHFLCVTSPAGGGGGYSLSDYGGALAGAGDAVSTGAGVSADGSAVRLWGLAVFRTANPANLALANRLDAVNTNFNNEALLGDGPGIDYAGEYNTAAQFSWLRRLGGGRPQDTNNSFSDFVLVSTSGGTHGTAQSTLGAPGPENLSGPLPRGLKAALIDPRAASSSAPNRARDTAPHACNGGAGPSNCTFGTLTIRRRFTNSTGAAVTRLRFRIVDVTTLGALSFGEADLRALSSGDVTVTVIGGSANVRGTTLEQPPAQSLGGGLNSTYSAGTISLATPLAAGNSVNVQFLLGVQQTGSFRFLINVEALP